jgi:hypothetical protein
LAGFQVFLFAGHLLLPQTLLPLETGLRQLLPLDRRQIGRLGVRQVAAFDGRQDLPVRDPVADALAGAPSALVA